MRPWRHTSNNGRRSRHRVVVALWVLLHLLFAQLALASYQCPGRASSGSGGGDGMTAEAALPDRVADAAAPCPLAMAASVMDPDLPHLCQTHCNPDGQAYNGNYQALQPGMADLGPAFLPPARSSELAQRAALQAPDLRRTSAPPLTVQHCCWRI